MRFTRNSTRFFQCDVKRMTSLLTHVPGINSKSMSEVVIKFKSLARWRLNRSPVIITRRKVFAISQQEYILLPLTTTTTIVWLSDDDGYLQRPHAGWLCSDTTNSFFKVLTLTGFSTPDHKVLIVSYKHGELSVVRRPFWRRCRINVKKLLTVIIAIEARTYMYM